MFRSDPALTPTDVFCARQAESPALTLAVPSQQNPLSPMPDKPNDVIGTLLGELGSLPDHPRILITVTHCYLELLVYELACGRCKNGKRVRESQRDYPQSQRIVLLHEAGVISDREAEVLHWFRKKRNEAAHETGFDVTADDLRLFKDELTSVPFDTPSNLRLLCHHIVINFWNHHAEFFTNLFLTKKLYEAEKMRPIRYATPLFRTER